MTARRAAVRASLFDSAGSDHVAGIAHDFDCAAYRGIKPSSSTTAVSCAPQRHRRFHGAVHRFRAFKAWVRLVDTVSTNVHGWILA
jgi:hypothetical protein